jgi:hypothetical protein
MAIANMDDQALLCLFSNENVKAYAISKHFHQVTKDSST